MKIQDPSHCYVGEVLITNICDQANNQAGLELGAGIEIMPIKSTGGMFFY